MQLRGIEFGPIFCAPGARGFFGEGYAWHKYARLLGMTWEGTTFVAKTTTLNPRLRPEKGEGIMPMDKTGLAPREFIPRCIVVKPLSGHVLNAVGLSGPGAKVLLDDSGYDWRKDGEPFMLSFMSVAKTKAERLTEVNEIARLCTSRWGDWNRRKAVHLNFACPNVGMSHAAINDERAQEISEGLEGASRLDVPLVPNFSVVEPVEVMIKVAAHPLCDALWIANTIPWGDPRIDWQKLFGSDVSPLTKRGYPSAGGLSGPTCLNLVIDRVVQLRQAGVQKPIVAGNGIQSERDVRRVFRSGADAVAIGSVGIVRPWRMRSIIQAAHAYSQEKEG